MSHFFGNDLLVINQGGDPWLNDHDLYGDPIDRDSKPVAPAIPEKKEEKKTNERLRGSNVHTCDKIPPKTWTTGIAVEKLANFWHGQAQIWKVVKYTFIPVVREWLYASDQPIKASEDGKLRCPYCLQELK